MDPQRLLMFYAHQKFTKCTSSSSAKMAEGEEFHKIEFFRKAIVCKRVCRDLRINALIMDNSRGPPTLLQREIVEGGNRCSEMPKKGFHLHARGLDEGGVPFL